MITNKNVHVLDNLSYQDKQKLINNDSLTNFTANMGNSNDKRAQTSFQTRGRLHWSVLQALYREDWIAGKIVDIIPDEMTRSWRKFTDDRLSPEQVKEIEKAEGSLGVKYAFNEAKKWARLYGGALILMNIEGTGEPHEPLDISRVRQGSLKNLTVYDSANANFMKLNTNDPMASNFLRPETYTISHSPVQIHHTRVLRFDGQLLPLNELKVNAYWHDSVLNRIYDALVNAGLANDSTAGLLFESNVDVLKVKNLMSMVSSPEGEKLLMDRFTLAKLMKSNNKLTLLDSEEELVKQSNSFAGIPDILDRFMTILSASSDIPATRLFGKAPVGMNATGESDLRNFYDHVREKQEFEFRPIFNYFDQILAKHAGIEIEDAEFVFNPLWQISDKEAAEVKLNNAQADQIYIDTNVIPISTVTKQLQQEGTYSNIDPDYIKELELAEKEIGLGMNEEGEEEEVEGEGEVDCPGCGPSSDR